MPNKLIKIKKFIFEDGKTAFASEGINIKVNKQDAVEITNPTADDADKIALMQGETPPTEN